MISTHVYVSDKQPPVINCPADIEETIKKAGETSMSISWETPTYKDNSGKATLTTTHTSPQVVPVDNIFPVTYTATDDSGKSASCTIYIKVNGKFMNINLGNSGGYFMGSNPFFEINHLKFPIVLE